MKLPKWPVGIKRLEILWLDAHADNTWTDIKDIDSKMEPTYSIGVLISESKDGLTVCCTFDPSTKSVNAVMTIPKSCIIRRRFIK